jgi:hypothetical protein
MALLTDVVLQSWKKKVATSLEVEIKRVWAWRLDGADTVTVKGWIPAMNQDVTFDVYTGETEEE